MSANTSGTQNEADWRRDQLRRSLDQWEASNFDPHVILGILKGASQSQIIDAHRRWVAAYHPDQHNSDPLATELTKRVNAARDELLGKGRHESRYQAQQRQNQDAERRRQEEAEQHQSKSSPSQHHRHPPSNPHRRTRARRSKKSLFLAVTFTVAAATVAALLLRPSLLPDDIRSLQHTIIQLAEERSPISTPTTIPPTNITTPQPKIAPVGDETAEDSKTMESSELFVQTIGGLEWFVQTFDGLGNAKGFRGTTYARGTFDTREFAGKPIVIHFFTQSCSKCIEVLRHLKELYQEFGEPSGGDVQFVGVQFVPPRQPNPDVIEKGAAEFNRLGVTFPGLPGIHLAISSAYGVIGYPVTVFLDRNHNVYYWVQYRTFDRINKQNLTAVLQMLTDGG